jgi:hypothetical protein
MLRSLWPLVSFLGGDFTPTPAATGIYANVRKTTSQSGTGVVVTYDTVASGDSLLFTDATDLFTVPAGATLVRLRAGMRGSGSVAPTIRKNAGTAYTGKCTHYLGPEGGNTATMFSALLTVTPGDTFDVLAANSWTLNGATNPTAIWFGFERVSSSARYCIATKSSDQAIALNVLTAITFNGADAVDTDALHDDTTNTHIFTVPAGGPHLVRFRSQLRVVPSGGSGEIWSGMMNPTAAAWIAGGFLHQMQAAGVDHFPHGCSAIISMASGTQFSQVVLAGSSSTATVKGVQETWAEMEILDPTTQYITRGNFTAGATVAAGGIMQFPDAIANTAGASYSGGQVTVPASITRARVSFNIMGPTSGAAIEAWGALNGAHVAGMPWAGSNGTAQDSCNAEGNWVTVAPGDLLDVRVTTGGSATYPGDANLVWMCIEFA